MPHILLITFLYEPEIGGGAAVVSNLLAHELSKRDYKVSVITSSPNNHETRFVELFYLLEAAD